MHVVYCGKWECAAWENMLNCSLVLSETEKMHCEYTRRSTMGLHHLFARLYAISPGVAFVFCGRCLLPTPCWHRTVIYRWNNSLLTTHATYTRITRTYVSLQTILRWVLLRLCVSYCCRWGKLILNFQYKILQVVSKWLASDIYHNNTIDRKWHPLRICTPNSAECCKSHGWPTKWQRTSAPQRL